MIKYLIAVLVLFYVISCDFGSNGARNSYGIAKNTTRKKNKVPIIDTTWIFSGNKKGVVSWENPDLKRHLNNRTPCYGKKQVYLQDGKLNQEIDFYYSGDDFIINKSGPDEYEVKENVQIGFNYSDNSFFIVSECEFFEENPFPNLEEVEELLISWGLERLNYR